MKLAKFNEDQAIILQTIEEAGEEDIESLAINLSYGRPKLFDILISLQKKGLIRIKNTGYSSVARLSRKGRKTARALWPELSHMA